MIDTQESRDRALEAAAEAIHEATRPSLTWEQAMDAARAVMEVPAFAACSSTLDLFANA